MNFHFIFLISFGIILGSLLIQEASAQSIAIKPVESNTYRIGHPLTLFLYEPDLNLDSDQSESYSLDLIIFRSEKVEITMGPKGGNQDAFNPKPSVLRETDDNSGLFYTVIEIPRTLNGQTIKFGEKIEFEYVDFGSVASVFVGDTTQESTMDGYISNLGAIIELRKKPNGYENESYVPSWIKTSAKWWARGIVPDSSFITGLEYMINQNYIQLDDKTSKQIVIHEVPEWLKVNALLWSEKIVSDSEFFNAIKFLIDNRVIN